MGEREWHVEMLWPCASCAEKNLGRHTQCQRCGKPKTGKEEYEMPPETDPAAAVTDPELLRLATAGANWRCRFCGSDQRRFDGLCGHCGADQAQGLDLGLEPAPEPPGRGSGHEAPAAAPRPAEARAEEAARKRAQRWLLVGLLPGGLLLLGGVLSLLLSRSPPPPPPYQEQQVEAAPEPAFRDVGARLAGIEWTHTVNVERYKVLSGQGFADAKPEKAFDLKKTGQRVHHTDRVPDGTTTESYTETVPDGTATESYSVQEACGETCTNLPQSCSNRCTSGKNGFANCKQVCTGGGRSCSTKYCSRSKTRQVPRTKVVTRTRQVPRFKSVPRSQDFFEWKYWDWAHQRSVKATGTTAETRWPDDAEVALNKGLGKGEQERASRAGTYQLRFTADDGASYDVGAPDLDAFRRSAAAASFTLRVERGHARVLDAPPAAAPSSR